MQAQTNLLPKCLTFQTAAPYAGVSLRTLQNWEKAGLLTVYNILQPGATRGRKLIDREKLDQLIESYVNCRTSAVICGNGGPR